MPITIEHDEPIQKSTKEKDLDAENKKLKQQIDDQKRSIRAKDEMYEQAMMQISRLQKENDALKTQPQINPRLLVLAELLADKYAGCKKRWLLPDNKEVDHLYYLEFKELCKP